MMQHSQKNSNLWQEISEISQESFRGGNLVISTVSKSQSQQQGRVILDADGNELSAIASSETISAI